MTDLKKLLADERQILKDLRRAESLSRHHAHRALRDYERALIAGGNRANDLEARAKRATEMSERWREATENLSKRAQAIQNMIDDWLVANRP